MSSLVSVVSQFDCLGNYLEDPFIVTPKTFGDSRGGFCQKISELEDHFNPNIIKQVNHSYSKGGVFRGFHAQKGLYCQGKLVENLTYDLPLYDIIIDARPKSKTFGHIEPFILYPANSLEHNLLWVPRGFFHAFVTPKISNNCNFIFQYYCDNVYNKNSEIGINPISTLSILNNYQNKIFDENWKSFWDIIDNKQIELSEKDQQAKDLEFQLSFLKKDYEISGKEWYK